MAGNAISGARARLVINDVDVGWATGVSVTETINQQPVEVLGDIDVIEHVPTSRTVSMSADFVRIKNASLQALGIWPRGDTVDVLNFPELSAFIYDIVDGDAIYRVTGVVSETKTWQVDQAGLMTKNCSFRCRRLFDELG